MEITYAPRDILQINDARIIFRNFAGIQGKYNKPGERNFSLVVPDEETANELINRGWNVRIKPPREEGEEPFRTLPVKVKFNDRGPSVYLKTNGITNKIDEESVGILDRIDIANVDLDIRPYDWERDDGETGRSAYLQSICVTQAVDRFAERMEDKYRRLADLLEDIGREEAVKVFAEVFGE